MSFDELPPDARSPRSDEGENRVSDRETSAADAPPAASPRRERAAKPGTDAASAAPAEPGATPARASSRRRRNAPGTPATEESRAAEDPGENKPNENKPVAPTTQSTTKRAASRAADSSGQTDVSAAQPAAAEDKPKRRRRTVSAAEEAADAPPAASPAPPAEPTRARRQTRRKATDAAEPAAAAPTPPQAENAPAEFPPAVTGSDVAAPAETPQKPSRRRSIRKPKEGTETAEATNLPSLPTELSHAEAGANPAPDTGKAEASSDLTAEAATDETPSSSNRNRRQRSGRNRRRSSEPVTNDVSPLDSENASAVGGQEEARAAEMTEAAAAEATETEDAPEGAGDTSEPRGRRRRNRRNNRSRRETRAEETISAGGELTGTAEIVADLTAEAVALPSASVMPVASIVIEEPVEIIDLNVGAHLIMQNGVPRIHLNGVPVPPVLFFGNMDGAKNTQRVLSEVRRAAKAGVHLHSTLVELPCPLSEASHLLDDIDVRLRALLDADPDGYVMPRLVFLPARGWKREYPTEISVYNDGTNGDPSLTSARFWQECERSLEMLIAHISSQTYGERVFGYHLERGEWFQPLDQGYDRSMANRDAFRDWLREKYQNSLILLRAAWYDGDVQFHTAEIPAPLGKPNPQRAFYETRRERAVIDFNEFTSETTANRLALLGRAVKKATHYNALVSVCYGYTLEFGHGFSGHLALDRLLASPHIDLITGPPSYRDRKPTGGASFPAPIDSLPLHSKLWLSEDDTKTYLAPAAQDPDDFNPRLGDRFATEQAQARTAARALATNTGVGWMDLWGEGWLDEDSLWERIEACTDRFTQQQRDPARPETPDVIALIDEKSLLHVQKGEAFFRKLTNGARDSLQRSGASYGIYLQSDLLTPDFPTDARLYIFLTPFRLTPEQRGAIKEKLQRDNKTLAWLYAPGACEERPTGGSGMEEVAAGVVGITLRPQAWNSEVGSRILDPNHVLTERLGGRDLGVRERLNPSFYVDDPGATVLAEYHGSGLPSLAARNLGNWKSVFVGDPGLPLDLLRGLCRYAGVPLYAAAGEDVITVGNGWIVVHASRDGQRTLRLPAAQSIYDLHERRLVAEDAREYRYFLRMGMTRVFCIGSRARFEALDLPNLTPPARNRPHQEREETRANGQMPSQETAEPMTGKSSQMPDAGNAEVMEEPVSESSSGAWNRDRNRQAAPFTTRPAETTLPDPTQNAPTKPLPPLYAGTAFDTVSGRPSEASPPIPAETTSADNGEAELEPIIEPFPEPRRTPPRVFASPASDALRADLETLKAVLEMEMPAEDEDSGVKTSAPLPPRPLPKEGLPGLEAVLGGDNPARRRRRRGGRGRGRHQNGAEEPGEGDTPNNDANAQGNDISGQD